MKLSHRIRILERRRPPSVAMPETITLFRGRDDGPRIPDGFFPCNIKIIRLGPDGVREEKLIWSEPEEVR